MKTCLFIAYHFPPIASPGAERARAFARDLPARGYRCRVVTTSAFGGASDGQVRRASEPVAAYRRLFNPGAMAVDEAIRSRVRTEAGALSVVTAWGKRRLLVPDAQIGWVPGAVRAGAKAAREGADLIYTTSPPHSAHLVGRAMQRRTGLPWVAEFRDTWTYDPLDPESLKRPVRRRIEAAMERMVLRRADRVIGVTTVACRALRALGAGDRVREVPNGFDGEPEGRAEPPRGDRLRMVHVGSFSASHAHRSPGTLLSGVKAAGAEVDLVLVGPLTGSERAMAGGIPGVSLTGPLGRAEALAWQERAHVLVVVDHPRAVRAGNVPSKCYEYLAAGRPILALTPEGATRDLIQGLGAGICAPPDDADAVTAAIRTVLESWRRGTLGQWRAAPERLRPYRREETARRLAEVFDEVVVSGDR